MHEVQLWLATISLSTLSAVPQVRGTGRAVQACKGGCHSGADRAWLLSRPFCLPTCKTNTTPARREKHHSKSIVGRRWARTRAGVFLAVSEALLGGERPKPAPAASSRFPPQGFHLAATARAPRRDAGWARGTLQQVHHHHHHRHQQWSRPSRLTCTPV